MAPDALRRALAAGFGALTLLVVALGVAAGDDAPPPRGTSLLDALAPVLSTGAPTAAGGDEGATKLGVPLDRAAAQLFVVGLRGRDASTPFLGRLRVRDWGGLLLARSNWDGPARARRLVRALRRTAARAGHTPPLVLGDASLPVALPPAGGLETPAAADRAGRAAGRALRAIGIDAVLGPPANLAYAGGAWERRGFPSEQPARVATLASAAASGLRRAGVLAVPGHFPGEGAASTDPRRAPATVGLGLSELVATELEPFRAVLARVRAVQVSAALYAAWDGITPATTLPDALRLLRDETGFGGVALSADLQAVALATGEPVGRAAVAALRAGCDLLLLPGDAADQEAALRAVVRALRSGELPGERVAEALRRAAALKRVSGVGAAARG